MLVLGFYARKDTSTRSRGNIYFIRYLSIKRKAMILMKNHFFVIFRNFRSPPPPQWNYNVNERWPAASRNRILRLWKAPFLLGVVCFSAHDVKIWLRTGTSLFQCFLLRHPVLHCIWNRNGSGHRISRCWDTFARQEIRPICNHWIQSCGE